MNTLYQSITSAYQQTNRKAVAALTITAALIGSSLYTEAQDKKYRDSFDGWGEIVSRDELREMGGIQNIIPADLDADGDNDLIINTVNKGIFILRNDIPHQNKGN